MNTIQNNDEWQDERAAQLGGMNVTERIAHMHFPMRRAPWRHDPRSTTFSHHRFFGTLTPVQLPDTLGRTRRSVENQKNTLRCTGYGTAVNGGYIHGMRMHPDWQAAMVGREQHESVDGTGGDPNAAMKSQIDYGYLPWTMVPLQLSLERNTIENTGLHAFDSIDASPAYDLRDAGFVSVDGPEDTFDNIRSALSLAYDRSTGLGATVQAFGRWYSDWSFTKGGIIPTTYGDTHGYHHYLFIDWIWIGGVPYLVVHNSGGTLMGDQGFQYMPREVVNREFAGAPGTSLKIVKTLTASQVQLAKQESPYGVLQRLLLQAWYALSEFYIHRNGVSI